MRRAEGDSRPKGAKERTKKIMAVKSAAEVRFAFTNIDPTRFRSNMINVGRFVSTAFRDAALFKAEGGPTPASKKDFFSG
jgi:hypothetical protein